MTINAYIYRPTPTSPGILVEILHNHVCECGNDGWKPLSAYSRGTFTKLVEEHAAPIISQDLANALNRGEVDGA